MKKLFFILMMTAMPVGAATKSDNAILQTPEMQQSVKKIFDMKMFHDPIIVKNMMREMQNVQKHEIPSDSVEAEMFGYEGVFTPKDAETLKKLSMQKRSNVGALKSGNMEQLMKQAETDPYNAMVKLATQQKISSLTVDEIKTINTIDDQTIPNMIQLTTSAGPDVGAEPVGIWYGLDQK